MNFFEETLYLASNLFSRLFATLKLYFKRKVSVSKAYFKTSAALSGLFVFNTISAIFTSMSNG